MKSASIYYRSRTGITKKLAENLAEVLKSKGLAVSDTAIPEEGELGDTAKATESDLVLLGCWTGGLFFFLQHPDRQWTRFAKGLPSLADKKVCLFTTYKIATGGMFKRMQQSLKEPTSKDILILRSKNGTLSAEDKTRLEQWAGV